MTDGIKSSMWAAAPSGYNAGRRWNNPPPNDPPRTSSQPPSTYRPPATSTNSYTPPNGPSNQAAPPYQNNPAHGGPATLRDTVVQPTYRPPAPPRDLAPAQALHRLEQTCLRLKWKSIDLDASYKRAVQGCEIPFPPDVAERNFKIDFYEFYAWIEQAIELLHRVFGVQILKIGTTARKFGDTADHTFHHNVLKELEDKGNPLHEVMGRGQVNAALWKAKELRNKWKEGGEDVPLMMYDLNWIVGQVLEGLERGYVKAMERVESLGDASQDEQQNAAGEGWQWMVGEQMDLDDEAN